MRSHSKDRRAPPSKTKKNQAEKQIAETTTTNTNSSFNFMGSFNTNELIQNFSKQQEQLNTPTPNSAKGKTTELVQVVGVR